MIRSNLRGMWPRTRPLWALCTLPACQAPQADTSPFPSTPPVTTQATSSSTGDTGGSSSASGSAESSSTTGASPTTSTDDDGSTTLLLDVGSDVDLGDGKPVGCQGKIDFLFVISRYAGMSGFQARLLDAFPKFIHTIQTKFADFDYHIMVVGGDPYWGADGCDAKCPTECVPGYPCNYEPSKCDTTIGAGVVFPAAHNTVNKPCPIDAGRRYMVKGQTDLEETFTCVAQVGTSGGSMMGQALAAAVQPWLNGPGDCNDGFLREDALLMVTVITNSYDGEGWALTSETGNPETWKNALRTAKSDDLESIVVLGIIPTEGPGCDEDDRLCQMLELFPYALNRDIAADDYGPFFDEATDLVETACAGFIVPG
jgi:hypothetical protein